MGKAGRNRALNAQQPMHDMTLRQSGKLKIPSEKPVIRLNADSPLVITEFATMNGAGDGYTLDIFMKSGSAAVTISEGVNIITTGVSLVLGALDSVRFRYDGKTQKWYQTGTSDL